MNQTNQSTQPPGPGRWKGFQYFTLASKDPIYFFQKIHQDFGHVVFFQIFKIKVLFLFEPNLIQRVLQDNHSNYTKSVFYNELKNLLGNGLLTNEGDFWKTQRKLIQPTFHKEKMISSVNTMIDESKILVSKWDNLRGKDEFIITDVSKDLMETTLQIVSKAVFDMDSSEKTEMVGEELGEFLKGAAIRIQGPIQIPFWLPTPLNRRVKKSIRKIRGWIDDVVQSKIKNPGKDLVSMLLELKEEGTNQGMTEIQIRDEAITMLLAGHETTSNALSWCLYLLAKNPSVFQKLEEELNQFKDTPLQFETLTQFKYARMVIDETLRMYPPAWVIERKSISEDQLGPYKISANTNISISVYEMHHDPRFWDSPLEFRPERFSQEGTIGPKFAYFPFGGGPRICIGNAFAIWEALILLITITRKYKPTLTDAVIEKEPTITLRPKNSLPLKMVLREKS
jgi:cytochrome P450